MQRGSIAPSEYKNAGSRNERPTALAEHKFPTHSRLKSPRYGVEDTFHGLATRCAESRSGVGHKARHIREHRPEKLQRRGQCGHECFVVQPRVDLEFHGVPIRGQAFGKR